MSSELKSKISASKTDLASPYDFTGSYKMAKWDGVFPAGYSMPCAAGESSESVLGVGTQKYMFKAVKQ